MAKKTTTKKSTKKTAKPATSKAVEFQQKLLERQQNAFDRTFEAITNLQERSEDRVNGWLEDSKYVPEEIAEMAGVWTTTARTARTHYRNSVVKSYELAGEMVGNFGRS